MTTATQLDMFAVLKDSPKSELPLSPTRPCFVEWPDQIDTTCAEDGYWLLISLIERRELWSPQFDGEMLARWRRENPEWIGEELCRAGFWWTGKHWLTSADNAARMKNGGGGHLPPRKIVRVRIAWSEAEWFEMRGNEIGEIATQMNVEYEKHLRWLNNTGSTFVNKEEEKWLQNSGKEEILRDSQQAWAAVSVRRPKNLAHLHIDDATIEVWWSDGLKHSQAGSFTNEFHATEAKENHQ